MRLLVVTNMYPLADDPSYGSFVAEQFASLRRAGVDADLYFIEGYRARSVYLRAVCDLRERRRAYDVVHAHHGFSALAAVLAGARPLIATFHDNEIVTNAVYRRFARWLARRCDCCVAVSAAAAAALAPESYVGIPMGVDLNLFRPLDRRKCRGELGLDDRRKYVLFPADRRRISKRYDLAEEAATLARQAEPGLELFANRGTPRDRVPLYFGAADAVLVTSDVELGPLTVKEAIACGRPAVSRRVGDVAFLDACPGCVAVDDDAPAIADGILKALTLPPPDPGAVTAYGMDAVARRLVSLYDEVTQTSPAARYDA